jgi:hypothetical protein
MRGRKIFLLLLLVGLIFSQCDSSSVEPSDENLNGEWNMVWAFQGDQLYGVISFEDGYAKIEAYGHDTSQLLSGYEVATFAYTYEDGLMTLINEETGIALPYTILEASGDEILLSYLDEIQIELSRKSD